MFIPVLEGGKVKYAVSSIHAKNIAKLPVIENTAFSHFNMVRSLVVSHDRAANAGYQGVVVPLLEPQRHNSLIVFLISPYSACL